MQKVLGILDTLILTSKSSGVTVQCLAPDLHFCGPNSQPGFFNTAFEAVWLTPKQPTPSILPQISLFYPLAEL